MARKQPNGLGERPRHNKARRRWEARYSVDVDGTRRQRLVTGPSAEAVRDRLRVALGALEQGLAPPDARTTVAAFTAWWLEHVLPGEGLAPATERYYRDVLKTYVLPNLGTRALSGPKALTVGDVEAMTAKLDRAGKSTRVQVAARVVVGKVLRAAEQRGLVARNVARLATRPKDRGEARKVKALSPAALAELLGALDGSRWHPVALVGVTTGLRPGEILGLPWDGVHLDGSEPYVTVRQSLSHVGGPAVKAPKRDRSYRTVPLAPEAVAALRTWRKVQREERLAAGPLWDASWGDLVFAEPDGTPRRVDVYRRALTRAIAATNTAALKTWKEAGSMGPKPKPLAHTSPHALRHTYATHLLEAGVPIHHVAELLGDTVAVVESTYSHVLRPKHEVTSVVSRLLVVAERR